MNLANKILTNGFDDQIFIRLSKYCKLPAEKMNLSTVDVFRSLHEKHADYRWTNPSLTAEERKCFRFEKNLEPQQISTLELMELSKEFDFKEIESVAKKRNDIYSYNLLLANQLEDLPFDSAQKQIAFRFPTKFPVFLDQLNHSNIIPNQTTVELCIRFSFSIQDVNGADRNIQLLEKIGKVPQEYYRHLFDGYCMLGDTRSAVLLLEKMATMSNKPHLASVIRLVTLLFSASDQSMGIKAMLQQLGLLESLKKPLNQLVKQKLLVGDVEVALRIYIWLNNCGLPTSASAYEVLLKYANGKIGIPKPVQVASEL
jgi:hypothetical protein